MSQQAEWTEHYHFSICFNACTGGIFVYQSAENSVSQLTLEKKSLGTRNKTTPDTQHCVIRCQIVHEDVTYCKKSKEPEAIEDWGLAAYVSLSLLCFVICRLVSVWDILKVLHED